MKLINHTRILALPVCITLMMAACGGEGTKDTADGSANTAQTALVHAVQSDAAEEALEQRAPAQPAVEMETTDLSNVEQTQTAAAQPIEALSLAEGKARYEKTCRVCHDAGLLDAPKLSAKEEWQKRLDAKGLETLQINSAKGLNKMPAQAVGDVSEAEVYAAVNYMLHSSL